MSLVDSEIKHTSVPEFSIELAQAETMTDELRRFFCGLNLTIVYLEAVEKFMDDEDNLE